MTFELLLTACLSLRRLVSLIWRAGRSFSRWTWTTSCWSELIWPLFSFPASLVGSISSPSLSLSVSAVSSCRCRNSLRLCAPPSTLIWRRLCRVIKRLCWSGWRSWVWIFRTTGCGTRCSNSSWPCAASCRSRSHDTTWTAWPKLPSKKLDYWVRIKNINLLKG